MGHYAVKQPDGKLAIWSTIVDSYIAMDCSETEAAQELGRYPADHVRKHLSEAINGERPEHKQWPHLLAWIMYFHGENDEVVKLAMERTPPDVMSKVLAKYNDMQTEEEEE